ncbi:putative receptor-type tyrosine-protein phosphatase mosPTP-1 isoform X2 [Tachypleus tridentatus]|uniref:putative receptor-type tyrosine-protein phosphatase mosPTP-1 isoform X2 n=1 Tax=Tachypleus tridentatus TaxID=6853 RepID=UPI003FD2464A
MKTWGSFFVIYILISAVVSVLKGQNFLDYGKRKELYVRAGRNVTILCAPAEDVSLVKHLEWWKEDSKIAEIIGEKVVVWEAKAHVGLQPNTYALRFRNVVYKDSGEYQCIVNDKKTRKGITRLFVQDIPDPPGMPLVTGFTSRSVNLSWASSNNNHNSPILQYIIQVRKGESGKWNSANDIMTLSNKTYHQVINLQPFTVYSFRILAVNAIGASKHSKPSYYTVTLREEPEGKPVITSAQNKSSTSIHLQWTPPPKDTIHGEFLGYRILYKPRDNERLQREIILRDPHARQYTIRNLDTFTQYLISVQVFNPEGRGPFVTVAVMTDEGVPSPPRNFSLLWISNNTVRLHWKEPKHPNGIILGYHVYYLQPARNLTEVKKVVNSLPVKEYLLTDLQPYTEYIIWLKPFTWKFEGQPSQKLVVRTDVQGPSAPYISNITCPTLDSLFLQWERPQKYYNQIDYYYVYFRSEHSWEFEEIALEVSHNKIDQTLVIPNLTANTMYEIKVCGATRSIIQPNKLYKGLFSESRKVLLLGQCQTFANSPFVESNLSAGLIAGVLCASVAFILAILSIILWRKYFQVAYYYLDDPPGIRASPQLSETFDDLEYPSIPVHQFSKHVADLHADGDIGFSKEYELIQQNTDMDLSTEYSQMNENKNKNRYVNIMAYDHTRVVLKPLPGYKKSPDYINGNFIDGYGKSNAYIGTQGPLPSTFDDYWQMIWEQQVYIIVMITNLVERGRRKCDMYWPKEGVETYGIIQVKLIYELVMATYTLRTFSIRNVKIKKKQCAERTVLQYHYTNWPDHGVPDHPLPVLSFIWKSSSANPSDGGPIVVHCSAGVGWTGTYIVIDAMLKQIRHQQSVNICGFLTHIRHQRNYLVQTEEQYVFIHEAIQEAIESGETEVSSHHLQPYILSLQSTEGANGEKNHCPLIEKQFKLVTSFRAKDFNVVSALKPCNKGKNRSLNLIPIESHRVHITPKPGTDGSDYINATFLMGFNKMKEFIVTQHPTYETVIDFWQMVWDHNTQTIVLLSYIDEKEYPSFWPEKGQESVYSTFRVKQAEESYQGSFITRDFILQALQDEYEVMCRVIQCSGWPEICSPLSCVFGLVHLVQEWHLEYQNGPMIVIDRYGGTEAATFCCLTTLFKQLQYEDRVDVYMYAKLYHMRRPGIWKTQDDYFFLYRALDSLIDNRVLDEADPSFSNLQMENNGHVRSNGDAFRVNVASVSL